MLQTMIEDLDSDAEIVPLVSQLGARHVRYGVRPEDYETVCDALTWALGQSLEGAFDVGAREAWHEAYWTFANIMRHAVETRPAESPAAIE